MCSMKLKIADNFLKRFKGLMFKDGLDDDQALLFTNTSRIHTSFMKFPIAVHYLDENFHTIDYEIINPWKIGKKVEGARHVVETNPTVVFKDKRLIQSIKSYIDNKKQRT